jgi:hypothetical protein
VLVTLAQVGLLIGARAVAARRAPAILGRLG